MAIQLSDEQKRVIFIARIFSQGAHIFFVGANVLSWRCVRGLRGIGFTLSGNLNMSFRTIRGRMSSKVRARGAFSL